MTKYDFSNAFGTTHPETVLDTYEKLSLSCNALHFLSGYLTNQRSAQTVVKDLNGYHISAPVTMERGDAQGQVGSDMTFLGQQLSLQELIEIWRSTYVDDLSDVSAKTTSPEAIMLALDNEKVLIHQSQQCGFMLNAGKTTYIPFNIPTSELDAFGLKSTISGEKCELLEFPFEPRFHGIDVTPCYDKIAKRLKARAPTIHASRSYVKDPAKRVKIAKSLIFECIGDLHLLYAYDSHSNDKLYNKIKVLVNDLLRATGLDAQTPSSALDKCLGTSLDDFVNSCVVLNGLKIARNISGFFDRTFSIRRRFSPGTYMEKFKDIWLRMPYRKRKKMLSLPSLNSQKALLKLDRKLKYEPAIHVIYKWKDRRNRD